MKLYVRSRHVMCCCTTPRKIGTQFACGANVRLVVAQFYFNDDALMLEEHCTGPCADQVSKLSAEVFGPPTGALGEGTFAAASQAPPWIHPGGPTVPGAQPLRDGRRLVRGHVDDGGVRVGAAIVSRLDNWSLW